MARVALTVSLTAQLHEFIYEEVSSGRYGTASEVIRDSLRRLKEAHERIEAPTSDRARKDPSGG